MTNSAMEKKATLVNAPQQTPWGYWQVLDDNEIYKVKTISVKPDYSSRTSGSGT
jgi:mannose-6-phosphate isomerase-like protein (cupin superfamily)